MYMKENHKAIENAKTVINNIDRKILRCTDTMWLKLMKEYSCASLKHIFNNWGDSDSYHVLEILKHVFWYMTAPQHPHFDALLYITSIKMRNFLACITCMNKLYQTHFIPNSPFLSICVYSENTALVLSMCTVVVMLKVNSQDLILLKETSGSTC